MLGDHSARVAAALNVDTSAITEVTELDGGMIGSVYRVGIDDGRTVVAKVGDTPLEVEAFMLRYLADESDLPVPAVLYADPELLVLSHVDGESTFSATAERDAAEHLCRLHDVNADAFGFPRDTLTGPVRQPNPWTDSWPEFFGEHRLRYVADLAVEGETLSAALHRRVDAVATDLDSLLTEPDAPSLIHGDVWATNLLARDDEIRAFLDPACYYAHPEVELAYVDWTDTFDEPFFTRYRESRGIESGFFERRRFVYRLYPLLVHVHLFGGEYPAELDETLERVGY
ncbi:fructosamine kinase family protein [Haloprofundus salinisoli]|uniref:fructosamine kinase family protein n=1 Tax=Haloprofundus salinisoli TaxID=2876193 RepID=UPI001CCDE5F6|nr:fructosamine kinase family protein [Haloprofundus salinisoli]